MTDVRIRRMTEADARAAHALEEINFPGDPWTEALFRMAALDPFSVCLCAEVSERLAGLVILRTVAGEGSIDNVSVDPSCRRRGVARTLVSEAAQLAKEMHGARAFTLEVRVSNAAACALYESLGFVNEGVRPGYYEHPREDAYIYWKREPRAGGEKKHG